MRVTRHRRSDRTIDAAPQPPGLFPSRSAGACRNGLSNPWRADLCHGRLHRPAPPRNRVIYAALGLPPRGGTPSISLIPPKTPVVVDVAELAHKPARLGASAVHYRRPGARTRPG